MLSFRQEEDDDDESELLLSSSDVLVSESLEEDCFLLFFPFFDAALRPFLFFFTGESDDSPLSVPSPSPSTARKML